MNSKKFVKQKARLNRALILSFAQLVFVAFAAGAGVTARTANGNVVKLAVAALIVVLAVAYVTSNVAIVVFHKIYPPFLLCAYLSRLFKVIDKFEY